MWFIGDEVEQETSAPPPKKILDPPLVFTSIKWPLCRDTSAIDTLSMAFSDILLDLALCTRRGQLVML